MKNWKKNFFAVILKHFENLSGSHHQIKITADYAKLNGGDNSVFAITALNLTNDELFIVEYFFSKAVLLHFGKKVILKHPTGTCCLQSRNFQNVRNKLSQFLSEEKKQQNKNKTQWKLPWTVQTSDLGRNYVDWCDLELELLSSWYKHSVFPSQFQQYTI